MTTIRSGTEHTTSPSRIATRCSFWIWRTSVEPASAPRPSIRASALRPAGLRPPRDVDDLAAEQPPAAEPLDDRRRPGRRARARVSRTSRPSSSARAIVPATNALAFSCAPGHRVERDHRRRSRSRRSASARAAPSSELSTVSMTAELPFSSASAIGVADTPWSVGDRPSASPGRRGPCRRRRRAGCRAARRRRTASSS